jgi:hypothetical protein
VERVRELSGGFDVHSVLEGRIEPGRVCDCTATLDEVPDGYRGTTAKRSRSWSSSDGRLDAR